MDIEGLVPTHMAGLESFELSTRPEDRVSQALLTIGSILSPGPLRAMYRRLPDVCEDLSRNGTPLIRTAISVTNGLTEDTHGELVTADSIVTRWANYLSTPGNKVHITIQTSPNKRGDGEVVRVLITSPQPINREFTIYDGVSLRIETKTKVDDRRDAVAVYPQKVFISPVLKRDTLRAMRLPGISAEIVVNEPFVQAAKAAIAANRVTSFLESAMANPHAPIAVELYRYYPKTWQDKNFETTGKLLDYETYLALLESGLNIAECIQKQAVKAI